MSDQKIEIGPAGIADQPRKRIGVAAGHPQDVIRSSILECLLDFEIKTLAKPEAAARMRDDFDIETGPGEHFKRAGDIKQIDVVIDRNTDEHFAPPRCPGV